MTFTVPFSPDKPVRACRVEVRKEGRKFYGDMVWSDGTVWTSWMSGFTTLKGLKQNVRASFDGFIVRI